MDKRNPIWLARAWEEKRHHTAQRVRQAIAALIRRGTVPSLRAISRMAEQIDHAPLSPNTIYRNEKAYELYLETASRRRAQQRRPRALKELCDTASTDSRKSLEARIKHLRRDRKDDLIARLLRLDAMLQQREQEAARLRNEILRLQEKLPRPKKPKSSNHMR